MDDYEKDKHPSYGMVTWSRQQHGSDRAQLFQSEMNHHEVISLRISGATLMRGLHRDWIHSDGLITEVCLSPAQFTQFLTSPNIGDGVPCTLQWTQKDGRIEQVYKPSRYHKYTDEIKEDMAELKGSMEAIEERLATLLQGKTIKKSDVAALTNMVAMLKQDLFANVPYLQEQMDEHMQKVVEQGKVEIESYLDSVIKKHGLEHLRAEAPTLDQKPVLPPPTRKRIRRS